MRGLLIDIGFLLTVGLILWELVRRLKRIRTVGDDPEYVAKLTTLSEASVRRRFDPYSDIDWDAPDLAVIADDPRWALPESDPLGRHPWYRAQPLRKQIEIGVWQRANVAKVGMQFEGILIRGLMNYAFWVPNGSPEYRYCVHESIEECNHTLMFQELINRIGVDVPGMPRWLKALSVVAPFFAAPMPNSFFFVVLAGEVPFDYLQTQALRDVDSAPQVIRTMMAIHVAEEARHISFAHEYLRRQVPRVRWTSRIWLSMLAPVVLRVLSTAMVVPPRSFFRHFDIPRSARKQWFLRTPESRQEHRDMCADLRMICQEVGLMNPLGRMMWWICRINGAPSRYRSQPHRVIVHT